ncbi:hypothetical protein C8T65DRAFT_73959 [Cerioporus squamosus]|nr:hypothetical protein C8T65DRAFT_73959 [Cerioporus squamosus]
MTQLSRKVPGPVCAYCLAGGEELRQMAVEGASTYSMRLDHTRSHALARCLHHRRAHVCVPATASLAWGLCSHICLGSRPHMHSCRLSAAVSRSTVTVAGTPPPVRAHFHDPSGFSPSLLPLPIFGRRPCRVQAEPQIFRKDRISRSSPCLVAVGKLEGGSPSSPRRAPCPESMSHLPRQAPQGLEYRVSQAYGDLSSDRSSSRRDVQLHVLCPAPVGPFADFPPGRLRIAKLHTSLSLRDDGARLMLHSERKEAGTVKVPREHHRQCAEDLRRNRPGRCRPNSKDFSACSYPFRGLLVRP